MATTERLPGPHGPEASHPFTRILNICGGDKTQAAWLLGTSLQTLEKLLEQETFMCQPRPPETYHWDI
ncbi:MAG TPA: hypothetical protein PLB67_06900 [Candidatus Hydrogenedentes bacterium]|jgi:hypothetical protein|nr:hypothetical protein [Candidatus Hydrogenedentota bacterium]MDY0034080.1 hypothetical protein [FCB group bacterium]NLT61323.1 hypothetical protein [Candidatus Hydrogenedentota bacterium]HNV20259.1 hypothetical protein [Candidatus Hydrogenedentota bacterium]HNZ16697.1 hypothetical protein [Candidatus Hydrogenedentota bacterium]